MKKQIISYLTSKVAKLYRKVCFVATFLIFADLAQAQFVHPGILSTMDELNVVKNNQADEPWKSALDALKASSPGSLSYSMQGPYSEVYRGSNNNQGWVQHGRDATACYVQALLGYITGNSAYTNNAISIINAWSNTLNIIGGNDVELLAGIQGPLWAQAGEILAHTNTGWASADITRAKNMLTNIFLPPMDGFASADGANFSTSCMYATMAIAVFTDNQSKFDEAWNAFISTAACPNDFSLYKNIASNGQNVESGRDQVHSWSSYEMLSGLAEIAYHQGYDPYTLGSNRLKTGVEYWCKYNLGGTVPYDESVYRCRAGWGPWSEISDVNSGVPTDQGSVCKMVRRAYERLGQSTPYTLQMADAMGNTVVGATARNGWGAPFIADPLLHNSPPGGSGGGATVDLIPTADVYVHSTNAGTNYGAETYMVTKMATNSRYAFLKFDLSSIPGSVTSAILKLKVKSVSAGSTRTVYPVSSDSWTESGITWNNKPSYGSALNNISISTSDNNTYVEWDITSYIASEQSGDGIATICVNDPSTTDTGIDFYTKESAGNKPVLYVAYNEPTTGTTYYQLQNRGTDLLLDGMGRTANGDACGQYANTTSTNAQWDIQEYNGNYRIQNGATGLYLDGMGRTSNGSDCGQWANTTSTNAQWRIEPYDGDYYRIQNVSTDLYLDGMGRTANGANCGQYANTTHPNAQWELISVSSGVRTGTSAAERQNGEEAFSDEVSIYPNPVVDQFTVKLKSSSKEGISIGLYNSLGKLGISDSFKGKKYVVDLSGLPAGFYILKVNDDQRSFSRKIVKE